MTPTARELEAERLRRVIARRIGGVLSLRKIDRADLADALGCTETKISRVVNGSSELSAVELVLAARFMGCTILELTGEK